MLFPDAVKSVKKSRRDLCSAVTHFAVGDIYLFTGEKKEDFNTSQEKLCLASFEGLLIID